MMEQLIHQVEDPEVQVPVLATSPEAAAAFESAEVEAKKALIQDEIEAIRLDPVLGAIQENTILKAIAERVVNERLAATKAQDEALNEKMTVERQASRDALTGLYNNQYGEAQMANLLRLCEANKLPLSFLMLDGDRFKQVNDTLGHAAGDKFIHLLGQMLPKSIRTSDLAYRKGGDEFGILLPGADLNRATIIAERIRSGVEAGLLNEMTPTIEQVRATNPDITPRTDPYTISIGISSIDPRSPFHVRTTPSDLKAQADVALYNSKHPNGQESARNRITVFQHGMTMPQPQPQPQPQQAA